MRNHSIRFHLPTIHFQRFICYREHTYHELAVKLAVMWASKQKMAIAYGTGYICVLLHLGNIILQDEFCTVNKKKEFYFKEIIQNAQVNLFTSMLHINIYKKNFFTYTYTNLCK